MPDHWTRSANRTLVGGGLGLGASLGLAIARTMVGPGASAAALRAEVSRLHGIATANYEVGLQSRQYIEALEKDLDALESRERAVRAELAEVTAREKALKQQSSELSIARDRAVNLDANARSRLNVVHKSLLSSAGDLNAIRDAVTGLLGGATRAAHDAVLADPDLYQSGLLIASVMEACEDGEIDHPDAFVPNGPGDPPESARLALSVQLARQVALAPRLRTYFLTVAARPGHLPDAWVVDLRDQVFDRGHEAMVALRQSLARGGDLPAPAEPLRENACIFATGESLCADEIARLESLTIAAGGTPLGPIDRERFRFRAQALLLRLTDAFEAHALLSAVGDI